ncbi:YeaC family protein [Sansalvadorimonas verongulae]|uniref:YeaC family protein n=1 Tax=Sansalvadorimonas verongulae TaxID=2172824 RepID=UPI0012BB5CB6
MDFQQLLSTLTPDIVTSLKRAVELGKWSDGRSLTQEQKEQSLQAVLAWEARNLPEEQRTGYMPQACKSSAARSDTGAKIENSEQTILRFQDA